MGNEYDIIEKGNYAKTETNKKSNKWLVTRPEHEKEQNEIMEQKESWKLFKEIRNKETK